MVPPHNACKQTPSHQQEILTVPPQSQFLNHHSQCRVLTKNTPFNCQSEESEKNSYPAIKEWPAKGYIRIERGRWVGQKHDMNGPESEWAGSNSSGPTQTSGPQMLFASSYSREGKNDSPAAGIASAGQGE